MFYDTKIKKLNVAILITVLNCKSIVLKNVSHDINIIYCKNRKRYVRI